MKFEGLKSIAKFLVALGAAGAILVVATADGIVNANEWLQIVLAFGGSLGVWATPNKKAE